MQLFTTYYLYDEDTDTEQELAIDFTYCRPRKGRREKGGPPLEPDEPAEIADIKVSDLEGYEIKVSEKEMDKIETACWDKVESYLDYLGAD